MITKELALGIPQLVLSGLNVWDTSKSHLATSGAKVCYSSVHLFFKPIYQWILPLPPSCWSTLCCFCDNSFTSSSEAHQFLLQWLYKGCVQQREGEGYLNSTCPLAIHLLEMYSSLLLECNTGPTVNVPWCPQWVALFCIDVCQLLETPIHNIHFMDFISTDCIFPLASKRFYCRWQALGHTSPVCYGYLPVFAGILLHQLQSGCQSILGCCKIFWRVLVWRDNLVWTDKRSLKIVSV